MKTNCKKKYLIPASLCLLVLIGIGYYYFFSSFTGKDHTCYVYVDADDNYDSLLVKLKPVASVHGYHAFKIMSRHSSLTRRLRTGRYAITPSTGAFTAFRHIKNGMQTPVNLTVPTVRTMQDLAGVLGSKLMLDSASIAKALACEDTCRAYGYDTATVAALFVPNTYDVYWNISLSGLLKRMQKENGRFWNDKRMAKAKALDLSPVEVATLASIVDEETANDKEKPMIAGMYYNRLKLRNGEYPAGMPLQADPTVKFALKRFELKRIYHDMLHVKSPYNTYVNTGLPPGPIRIASVAGIDAVLDMVHHNYLYMCAKEDFSGTHNFAATYQEHMNNAQRYAAALNARGIE